MLARGRTFVQRHGYRIGHVIVNGPRNCTQDSIQVGLCYGESPKTISTFVSSLPRSNSGISGTKLSQRDKISAILTPLRYFSIETTPSSENSAPVVPPLPLTLDRSNDEWELVYAGPMALNVYMLKRLSVSSLTASAVIAPAMAVMETTVVTPTVKMVCAATILFFGVMTTVTTNFICHPYVTRMFISKIDPNIFECQSIDFLARVKTQRFNVNDAFEYTITRPLANVKHKPSGRYLFFQQDKATHPIFATMFPHNFEKDDGNPDNLIIKENLNQSHLVNDLIKQNQQHVQHVERDQASSAQVEDHSEQQQPQQTPSDQTASTTKVTWKDIQKQNTSNQ